MQIHLGRLRNLAVPVRWYCRTCNDSGPSSRSGVFKRALDECQGRSCPLPPLLHQRFVVSLLPTRLLVLDLAVLSLEPAACLLCSHCFVNEILRTIFAVDASRIEFSWASDDSAILRKLGDIGLGGGFLVVPVRIEHGPHRDELEIALEGCSRGGSREVKPFHASICWFCLRRYVSRCFGTSAAQSTDVRKRSE